MPALQSESDDPTVFCMHSEHGAVTAVAARVADGGVPGAGYVLQH